MALKGLSDPLERWRTAVRAYCRVVDQHRESCVLAYRSTKSLSRERRRVIKQSEMETNALVAACVRDCIARGIFRPVNVDLTTYELVMLAHTWALKHWRLRDLCTLDAYVEHGLDLFAHALLTPKGWRSYRRLLGSSPETQDPSGISAPVRGHRGAGPAPALPGPRRDARRSR